MKESEKTWENEKGRKDASGGVLLQNKTSLEEEVPLEKNATQLKGRKSKKNSYTWGTGEGLCQQLVKMGNPRAKKKT